jgi:hypothetical protein
VSFNGIAGATPRFPDHHRGVPWANVAERGCRRLVTQRARLGIQWQNVDLFLEQSKHGPNRVAYYGKPAAVPSKARLDVDFCGTTLRIKPATLWPLSVANAWSIDSHARLRKVQPSNEVDFSDVMFLFCDSRGVLTDCLSVDQFRPFDSRDH